jgi:ABC-2 type transport system ATP-binding protein
MKKKLALTGILLQQNQYYIFDEPYNGVDIQSNMLITEIIRELRKLGKTVLLSSHIFSTLSENCDFILHLKAGLLVKTIGKSEFGQLENEMKETSLKNKIEQLGLQ